MTLQKQVILFFFLWHLVISLHHRNILASGAGGKWELLVKSVGISAMHMQLLSNDRVVMFDRTDFGKSNISLPDGKCRNDNNDTALKVDCSAHSVEYDVLTNTVRPLMVLSDVWCSSGSVMADGSLIQTGGFNDGDRVIRSFQPCFDGCDWKEIPNGLIARRWYASNHLLPDGRQIIIGGRRQFNYEFYPKSPSFDDVYSLPFLVETNDPRIENNLYPFVFLNSDGNLFIFANNRAILFDYKTRKVAKTYPQISGGDPRCYPSTGSAVLLPLNNLQDPVVAAQVLVCGGAPKGSYLSGLNGQFVGALKTCARISINEPNAQWTMETMPSARVMGDMLVLPNGHVLIINGAALGTAGWESARNPVLNPVVYKPDNPLASRFEVQNPSTIPRMYHSTAVLVRDGRVLVGGSNPHALYEFGNNVLFPTELSLEAFSPSYLEPEYAKLRPKIIIPAPSSQMSILFGTRIKFRFSVTGTLNANMVKVTMVSPSFNTHSYSMNQRLLVLKNDNVTPAGRSTYEVKVTIPSSGNLAPAGYYIIFVVHQDIPSEGIWARLQ
ncbi:hypothetical protein LIER_37094 [Lithospermum erythrorhizon]|uniref:Aldehyde oxidase GLOX n=1 Tax=Lithospermum erythrorhizon TaxID=34254 RepID=A0AAV3PH92_LITER